MLPVIRCWIDSFHLIKSLLKVKRPKKRGKNLWSSAASDCQQKNRYINIFAIPINQAIFLKFTGSVHHPMEQLMYKCHVYTSNGIDFIPPFVTYPYLLHTNHEGKRAF